MYLKIIIIPKGNNTQIRVYLKGLKFDILFSFRVVIQNLFHTNLPYG